MLIPQLILCAALALEERGANTQPSYGERIQAAYEHALAGELDAARAALDATDLAARGFEWSHANLAIELARTNEAGPGLSLRRGPPSPTSPRIEPVSMLFGHTASVRTIAVAPTGDRLATGGEEHVIHLWNARTGDPERTLAGHGGSIVGLSFSKDGRRLASGSKDGNAILWDLADGSRAMTFRAGGEALTAIAWNATNEWLATADVTFGVRLWNATNSEARSVVRGHTRAINGLAFSPDGKHIASASDDGSVRVVLVENGDVVRVFKGNGSPCTALVFEPDGTKLRVATAEGSVRRLDIEKGIRIDASASVNEPLWCLAATADGKRFATGSDSGVLGLQDSASKLTFASQRAIGPLFAVAFDSTASRLFAAGEDHVVYAYETDAALARTLQRSSPTSLPDDETAAQMKPLALDRLCRRVVDRPGMKLELYARAGQLASEAATRAPSLGQLQSTMGAALYRQELFEDALSTLLEANAKRRGWPPNLAYRAMALAKLGRIDEARELLDRLETLMREERWKTSVEELALLEEARAVVAFVKPAQK